MRRRITAVHANILSKSPGYVTIGVHRRISSSGVERYRASCSECPSFHSKWVHYPGYAEQSGLDHAQMKHNVRPNDIRTLRHDSDGEVATGTVIVEARHLIAPLASGVRKFLPS